MPTSLDELDARVNVAPLSLGMNGMSYSRLLLQMTGALPGVQALIESDTMAETNLDTNYDPTALPAIVDIRVQVVPVTEEPESHGDGPPVLASELQVYFDFCSSDGLISLIQTVDQDIAGREPLQRAAFLEALHLIGSQTKRLVATLARTLVHVWSREFPLLGCP